MIERHEKTGVCRFFLVLRIVLGQVQIGTGLASLCVLRAALFISGPRSLACRSFVLVSPLTGESLSLACPRESNQREGHPTIRTRRPRPAAPGFPRSITTPGARHEGPFPGPSWLLRHPCRSTPYVAIPLGLLKGTWASSTPSQLKSKGKGQTPPISIPQRLCKLAPRPPEQHRGVGSFAQQNPEAG